MTSDQSNNFTGLCGFNLAEISTFHRGNRIKVGGKIEGASGDLSTVNLLGIVDLSLA